jgi:hypothetical protein
MDEKMDGAASSPGASANYSRFTDSFTSSVKLPPNYGLSSFFIPSGAAFRINRSLEQKMDVPLDTLGIGGNLRFDAVNMFGAFGAAPLFSFYQSDEFSHSIDVSAAFPKNEKTTWGVQAAQTMNFRGFAGAELGINNTLTVNSASSTYGGARVTERLAASWTAPVEKSLLSFFYGGVTGMLEKGNSWLVMAGIAGAEYERLLIETLEFVFEHEPGLGAGEEDFNRFSVTLGHESVVRVFGRLNLSAFAKLIISEDYSTEVFSFLGSVGVTLSISF